MRVAVHYAADHPQHPGAVFAHRLGRIEDGVHNAPAGHEPVELEQYVNGLVDSARAEFPDAELIRVERLIDNGDGTAAWIDAAEFDPGFHTPVGSGQTIVREVTASAEPAAVNERS